MFEADYDIFDQDKDQNLLGHQYKTFCVCSFGMFGKVLSQFGHLPLTLLMTILTMDL